MRILFLGDVVGQAGCNAIKYNLQRIIKEENIDFTIVNGENSADEGDGAGGRGAVGSSWR